MTGLEKAISELYRLHTQIAVAGAAVTGVIEAQGLAGTCHEAIITHLADSARLADGIAEEMETLHREHKEHQATADTDAQAQAKARAQTIAYLRADMQPHVDAGRLTTEQADDWAESQADVFRDSIARGGASKAPLEHFRAFVRAIGTDVPEETKAASAQTETREQTVSDLRADMQPHVDAGRMTAEQADHWAEHLADLVRRDKTPAKHFREFTRTLETGRPESTEAASPGRADETGDRKILHMQVRGRGSKQEVVALCDDGSLWLGDWGAEDREGGVVYPDNFGWWRLPAVPGSNPAAGRPEREAL